MTALQPVRIIGGGLAGLSLGIALRKVGVTTEIFEAGDYPRHRVCGEFVTGLGEVTIEKLGIGPAFAVAGCHSSVTWFLRGRAAGRPFRMGGNRRPEAQWFLAVDRAEIPCPQLDDHRRP